MITGRVIGHLVSTINHPFYDGKKLMIVEKTAADGTPKEDYLVAIDAVGAGVGQPVMILDEGNGARQIVGSSEAPVRSVIVGIIDDVTTA